MTTIKIATILDTFSYQVFKPEAELLQLTPQHWHQEIETFQPDLLFVESAWRGKDNLWKDVIKHIPKELKNIIYYCQNSNIPTVFWNKEDPYHFSDFIHVAKLFDFVFTTDIECIPLYRQHLKHDRIYLLPFACQPKIHNPIEKYERKDAFVFAGAYYQRFPERNEYFKNAIKTLSTIGDIDIYDRNYGQNTVFIYPEEYHIYIRGGLDYQQIDKAYKGYRFAINLNSMTISPTMFSRRVFELIASNTTVINNYTIGVKLLLGDLTICTNNMEELKSELLYRKTNQLIDKKIRLAALRKVLSEHTAKQRLAEIISKVLVKKHELPIPTILCISYIEDDIQLCNIHKNYTQQEYGNKQLLLIIKGNNINKKLIPHNNNIHIISETELSVLNNKIKDSTYLAFLCSLDYYGKHYLTDLILATQYTHSSIITKGGQYTYNGRTQPILNNDHPPYQYTSFAVLRASLIKNTHSAENIIHIAKNIANFRIDQKEILAIDEFNYCKNIYKTTPTNTILSTINDLDNIDTGATINDIWIKKELDILQHLKKESQTRSQLSPKIIFWLKKLKNRIIR